MKFSKRKYIKQCKRAFLQETEQSQKFIQNADTDFLINEYNKYILRDKNYLLAIKYELMLRNDFKIII